MNLLIFTNPALNKDYTKVFELIENLEHNLIGFIRIDGVGDFSQIDNYKVYPLSSVKMLKYDLALVAYYNIYDSLIDTLISSDISRDKIKSVYWLLQQKMIKKYEDVQDKVIQETLEYWKTHKLTVFNQHTEFYEHTYDEMHMDNNCGLPYINFKTVEGKERRMYYPAGSGTRLADGKVYIKNVLREQVPTSPHLYTTAEHKVNDGDVLIDAGVCEGNFALKYVDVCSKIYLFEMDQKWFAPLYFTFKDYWHKVELITKAVGISGRGGLATLDDVVNEPVGSNIFLKMDIEGAEVDALHGAQRILQSNNVRASVCSYHRKDDCWKIKSVFQKYGYQTATSGGYMVFIWDNNIWDSADFRKGIVYAKNY